MALDYLRFQSFQSAINFLRSKHSFLESVTSLLKLNSWGWLQLYCCHASQILKCTSSIDVHRDLTMFASSGTIHTILIQMACQSCHWHFFTTITLYLEWSQELDSVSNFRHSLRQYKLLKCRRHIGRPISLLMHQDQDPCSEDLNDLP